MVTKEEVTPVVNLPSKSQPLLEDFKKISVENLPDELSLFSSPTELLLFQETLLSLQSKRDEEVHITRVENQYFHNQKKLNNRSFKFLSFVHQLFYHELHNHQS